MEQFNQNFILSCQKKDVSHIPVWFMRQAGRYQAEYREIRKKYSLVEICYHPEICAEVTILPIKQLGVDAAILFSDIMIPLKPMGVDFEIKEGIGPVISNPIQGIQDILKLKELNPYEGLPYVGESVKILKRELSVPLIGFCGAPFTLASYMIEGGPSKNYYKTKQMMYNSPMAWHLLMDKLAIGMATYLNFQIESGAAAIQVFDSWVGALNARDYKEFIYPSMEKLFSLIKDATVPKIHFGVNNRHLLQMMSDCGATVVGLDWRTEISEAQAMIGNDKVFQGNLDPSLLLADWNIIQKNIDNILSQAPKTGFVFNLGHGIMPQASGDILKKITDYVHSKTEKKN